MEDIRIGRRTNSSMTSQAALVTAYEIAQANPDRITLVIHPPVSGTLMISNTVAPTLTDGIPLTSTSHPLIFDIKSHGTLVQRRFFAIHSAGAISTLITEVMLTER